MNKVRYSHGIIVVTLLLSCVTLTSGVPRSYQDKPLELSGHTDHVWSVCFSADGKHVYSGSLDRSVRIWDISSAKEVRKYTKHLDAVSSVAISPDGNTLAVACAGAAWAKGAPVPKGGVRLLKAKDGTVIKNISQAADQTLTQFVTFSSDGNRLGVLGNKNTVQILDATSGKLQIELKGHTKSVFQVALHPKKALAATASSDETVRIWDLKTGKELSSLSDHIGWVRAVEFSPDGSLLATAGHDTEVRVVDTTNWKTTAVLKGHTSWVFDLVFSPKGNQLASCSKDGTIRMWDLGTKRQTRLFSGAKSYLNLAISPGGQQIAAGTWDATVEIWQIKK